MGRLCLAPVFLSSSIPNLVCWADPWTITAHDPFMPARIRQEGRVMNPNAAVSRTSEHTPDNKAQMLSVTNWLKCLLQLYLATTNNAAPPQTAAASDIVPELLKCSQPFFFLLGDQTKRCLFHHLICRTIIIKKHLIPDIINICNYFYKHDLIFHCKHKLKPLVYFAF